VKTFWHLITLYKNASNALNYVGDLSLRGGKEKSIKIYPKTQAEEEIAACEKKGVKILSYLDYDFPSLLKTTDDCPPLLFCLGNTSLLNGKTIAIVGSRNASANGLRFAYKTSKTLAMSKQVIVSGFARGIDNAAHKASVEHATIAVLAGGVDHIYPPEHEELYKEISERGLIVAELPLGSIPKPQNFPQRNRIISGISNAVAVIEASLKSGSLITAKFAIQQNREVFAVPGFPLDPRYQGNNYLLKQGAHLLETAEDILDLTENSLIKVTTLLEQKKQFLTTPKTPLKINFTEKELTQARIELINLVGISPTSIDEIVSITQLPVGLVLTAVVELELAGKIIRHFGNKISVNL
jgi:DNA processing protein